MPGIGGISTTMISSGFSAIMGFIMKSRAQAAEIEAAKHKHTIEALAAQSENYARHVDSEVKLMEAKASFEERVHAVDPERAEARRNIAYGIVFGVIIGLPLYLWQSGIEWIWAIEYTKTEGLFFWQKKNEVVDIVTQRGLPVGWLWASLELAAAVVSFYFGGTLAKSDNPYKK